MKKIEILVFAALVLTSFVGTGAAVSMSNSGGGSWQYYREITVSNSGSALSDYQVLVSLTSSSFPVNAQTSGADIRFTDAGGTELSYWIESWDYAGKSAKIWVKVPSIPASSVATIRMYYGNPSASSASNSDTTFDFFDNFDGTSLDINKWYVKTGASYVVSGGTLKIAGIGGPNGWGWGTPSVYSKAAFNDYVIEARVSHDTDNSLGDINYWLIDATHYYAMQHETRSEGFDDDLIYNDGWLTGSGGVVGYLANYRYQWNVNEWVRYTLKVHSNIVDFERVSESDATRKVVGTYLGNPRSFATTNRKIGLSGDATNGNFVIDRISVRKYASPEPSLTVGAEQPVYTPTGSISVSSSPSGAGIYLDGSYQSTTPYTITNVQAGSHTVTLKLSGYQDWSTTVNVVAGQTSTVSASLTQPTPTPTTPTPTTSSLLVSTTPRAGSTGIVGEWHFDGNAKDSSGNGNNGIIHGATFVQGISGQALSFNGVDNYVEIPASGSLSFDASKESYSVEMWFKINQFSNSWGNLMLILDRPIGTNTWESYGLGIDSSSKKLGGGIWNGNGYYVHSPNALSSGSWYHVVSVVKANQVQELYLNGNLVDSININGIGNTKGNTGSITIGCGWYPDGRGCQVFNGIIDEVKIYNRALSASEIQSNYIALMSSTTPTLTKTPLPVATLPKDMESEPNWAMIGGIGILILLCAIAITKLRPKKEKHDKPVPEIIISPTTHAFPTELKNYTGIELIGEGGFARVFKANRKKDNKTVAVKIPRLDEKTGKAFLNEIMAWHNLNHENIVKLFDANVHPVPYLEMEYIDGVEISGNRIRDLEHYPKPLKEERAVEIIKGIAEGLRHAHSKGVVHRDLKPLNVLITSGLTPKITDFGLAKLSAESKLSTLKGYSPLYAAPEQLDSATYGKPDERTDIYQLGVIFYELLTGKLPYEGYTQSEVSTKIITPAIQPTKPSVHNPELEKYDDIVMRCLAKKKENRFRDVNEFLGQLEIASEKESLVEQLKKTLNEQKETLKKSRSSEEIVKSKRMVVETLGRLAVIHAESKNKTELLNALEDLKFYTVKNIGELSKAIEQLEFMMKNESGVSEQFVSGIKNLLHKIRREYEL